MGRIGALVGLACVALGGCSPVGGSTGSAAATNPGSTASASPLARARATHEYPAPPGRSQTAVAPAASAVEAVRAFALGYINWNADTVATQLLRLASRSIRQARSAMQLAAEQAAADYELQRGGIANHGTVEAVAALRGTGARYVVVTREWTTAALSTAYQGLRPAWHIAVASVSELAPGQWVVSAWQPES